MAYGLQIFNTSGIIQIDDEYSNFGLIASGTAYVTFPTLAPPGQGYLYHRIYYPDCGTPPLVFIRPLPNNIFFQAIVITPTYMEVQLWTIDGTLTIAEGNIEYRIYAPMSQFAPSSGSGLVIRKANGQVAFDSSAALMRINGFHYLPLTNTFMRDYVIDYTAISAPTNCFFSVNGTTFIHDVYFYDAEGSSNGGGGVDPMSGAINIVDGSIQKVNCTQVIPSLYGNGLNSYPIPDSPLQVITIFD
jgi:hypothetical protein